MKSKTVMLKLTADRSLRDRLIKALCLAVTVPAAIMLTLSACGGGTSGDVTASANPDTLDPSSAVTVPDDSGSAESGNAVDPTNSDPAQTTGQQASDTTRSGTTPDPSGSDTTRGTGIALPDDILDDGDDTTASGSSSGGQSGGNSGGNGQSGSADTTASNDPGQNVDIDPNASIEDLMDQGIELPFDPLD